jgi:CRP-like cAMP-binding protein
MSSCIIEKFSHYTDLTDAEKKYLQKLEDEKISYKAGDKIRSKGDGFEDIYVIYDGWTYVSSNLDRNIRTIFDIRMASDFVGVSELSFNERLYDFVALTDTVVCPFSKDHLNKMFRDSEKLRRIFFLINSREQALLYERLISLGRRTAMERLSHFIAEIALRNNNIGSGRIPTFDFPLSQGHLADILGLSNVHVSRSLNDLKNSGYIDYTRKTMTIKNHNKLLQLANFDPRFWIKPDIRFIDGY